MDLNITLDQLRTITYCVGMELVELESQQCFMSDQDWTDDQQQSFDELETFWRTLRTKIAEEEVK